MPGVCGAIGCAFASVKTFSYDITKNYVGYIGSYENNLCSLRKNLSDVCNKKDDISKKVKEGEDKLERITREAERWLEDVRLLTGEVDIKSLMQTDIETAKFVIKLMENKDLKKLVREDGDMQQLLVEVMNMLKEEMVKSEDQMRLIAKEDYKRMAEIVVEVMKDTTEEFKKLMKKDKWVAVMATRMLKDSDLYKLTKHDKEMEDIFREAGSEIDADEDEEESDVLIVTEEVVVNENVILKAAKKLVVPLENLLSLAGKLMDDDDFKTAVPVAVDVKLGLDVIDGLLMKNGGLKKAMVDSTRQHESCCCFCAFVPCYYHNRYKVSIAAETLAKRIDNDIIKKCPGHPVTVCMRLIDMKRSPTQFLKGLQSRDRLLQEILKILRDDHDEPVGLYGMGGCGKTTLAKEVAYVGVDMFSIMVEISKCPDVGEIQGTIAESIDLPLHDVHNIAHRAIKLYNALSAKKEKKILIILDNIWDEINLDDIGIPRTCKLLLTTREKDVCRFMGVNDANTHQVGLLDATEGKSLLCSRADVKVDSEDYKTVIDRLLSKCGGLPLAIVVTAKALKGKDLPDWRKFADELEKPLSSQLITSDRREIYSSLLTSYRFMESKDKRMFFLLCCLWCSNAQIPIKAVMRCGIGLDFFKHVNKLSDAVRLADKWADDLVLSSMLLKPDYPRHIKIHDVVRDFGIQVAAKDDGHKFLVDIIPSWTNKKTLTEYTAISLIANNNYSRLIGINSNELQILLLRSTVMPDSPSSFSGKLKNLTVLNLGKMNFHPKLPESIGKLVELRTLYLESCKLGDIKVIGELVNLSFLGLIGSDLEELPNEIGKLTNLRLLDMTNCSCKLRPDLANILGGLSELQGLFIIDIFASHLKSSEDGGTSYAPLAIEFNNLNYLNALEMHIWCAEQLSIDALFVENLDSFRIFVMHGKLVDHSDTPVFGSFLFILHINIKGMDMGECLGEKTFKALLKKADWLRLSNTSNFSILHDELDDEGFPKLRHLEVDHCKDVNFIVNIRGKNDLLVFPSLESLKLHNLAELKGIFIENAIGNGRHDVVELPFLHSLNLSCLDHLVSVLGSENLSGIIGDGVQEHQVFFNPRIVFSSLEEFSLSECKRIVKLWDKDLGISSFQSLRTIKIAGCEKLSSVGSLSLFSSLVQLESLTIEGCKSMHEVITTEGTEELQVRGHISPVKELHIGNSSNLKSLYGGTCKLKFPNLKNLQLDDLGCLNKFTGSENQSALFHKEMDFPCLEELSVSSVNDEVMGLWDWPLEEGSTPLSNPVPMLIKLKLCKIKGCRQIPSIIYKNLISLELNMFNDNVLLSSGNEGSVCQLPKLENLCVRDNNSLENLLRKEDLPRLKSLELIDLPSLKIFPLHSFENLWSLMLFNLSWDYAFSADAFVKLEGSLQQLEILYIISCKNMSSVIQVNGKGDAGLVFKFPRLKEIIIGSSSIIGFSTTVNATLCLPILDRIEIRECDVIQHFWSGPIIAPKLQEVTVKECKTIKSVFAGNPNHMVQLPSLRKVSLRDCVDVLSLSSGPLTAPNLKEENCDIDFGMNLNNIF